jgi:hypothetical protein
MIPTDPIERKKAFARVKKCLWCEKRKKAFFLDEQDRAICSAECLLELRDNGKNPKPQP